MCGLTHFDLLFIFKGSIRAQCRVVCWCDVTLPSPNTTLHSNPLWLLVQQCSAAKCSAWRASTGLAAAITLCSYRHPSNYRHFGRIYGSIKYANNYLRSPPHPTHTHPFCAFSRVLIIIIIAEHCSDSIMLCVYATADMRVQGMGD